MDEPTASLSAAESEQLFSIIRDLAARWRRHPLRLAPARRGARPLRPHHRSSATAPSSSRRSRGRLDKKGLVRAIIGHDVGAGEQRSRTGIARDGTPLFSARAVSRGNAVKGVSFDVFPGEVFALGGLVGSGRTEVARLAARRRPPRWRPLRTRRQAPRRRRRGRRGRQGHRAGAGRAAGAGHDARPVGRLQHQRRLAVAAPLDARPAFRLGRRSRAPAPSG